MAGKTNTLSLRDMFLDEQSNLTVQFRDQLKNIKIGLMFEYTLSANVQCKFALVDSKTGKIIDRQLPRDVSINNHRKKLEKKITAEQKSNYLREELKLPLPKYLTGWKPLAGQEIVCISVRWYDIVVEAGRATLPCPDIEKVWYRVNTDNYVVLLFEPLYQVTRETETEVDFFIDLPLDVKLHKISVLLVD